MRGVLQKGMLILAVIALVPGCGMQQAAARAKRTNDLKAIGLAYHNYHQTFGKGPAKAEDLKEFLYDDASAWNALQSGDVVLIYGVNIATGMPQGASITVLGHEKDASTKSGLVLLGDASVKSMTADEFKAAPKAQAAGK
jgi:hypothetical protein